MSSGGRGSFKEKESHFIPPSRATRSIVKRRCLTQKPLIQRERRPALGKRGSQSYTIKRIQKLDVASKARAGEKPLENVKKTGGRYRDPRSPKPVLKGQTAIPKVPTEIREGPVGGDNKACFQDLRWGKKVQRQCGP